MAEILTKKPYFKFYKYKEPSIIDTLESIGIEIQLLKIKYNR